MQRTILYTLINNLNEETTRINCHQRTSPFLDFITYSLKIW